MNFLKNVDANKRLQRVSSSDNQKRFKNKSVNSFHKSDQRLTLKQMVQKQLNQDKINKIELPLQREEQEDSRYWQDENNQLEEEKGSVQKAIQKSMIQLLGFNLRNKSNRNVQQQLDENNLLVNRKKPQLSLLNNEENNRNGQFIDLSQYEQYRHISSFNQDFITIVQLLESLRQHTSSLMINNQPLRQSNNKSNVITNSQSYILQMIQNLIITHSKEDLEQRNILESIIKLQKLKDVFQSKLQLLKDQVQWKKSYISQINSDKHRIQDQTQLLQSRNIKLKKQLQGNSDSSSEEQDYANNEVQQKRDNQTVNKNNDNDLQNNSSEAINHLLQEEEQIVDYESEYLSILAYYELYNPQTQQLEQQFPKNKTEAMMLLNKIQAKIQQIEMQKCMIEISQ